MSNTPMVDYAKELSKGRVPFWMNGLSNLELALHLSQSIGWYVFPCREYHEIYTKAGKKKDKIKSPYLEGGEDGSGGYKFATTDRAQIVAWWREWPLALVGINCAKSGLIALDCDVPGASHPDLTVSGIDELTQIITEAGEENKPCQAMQKTMSGGLQVLYNVLIPDGYHVPANLKPAYQAIDIKYRGYVCTGKLPDGSGYQWIYAPRAGATADVPVWLANFIVGKNRKSPTPPAKYANTTPDAAKVAEAVNHLSISRADDYSEWVEVGMALYDLGNDGLSLWDSFSRRSSKYVPGETEKKWKSFSKHSGCKLTPASIFFWAKQDSGFSPAKSNQKG